jgi:hypothetical protein
MRLAVAERVVTEQPTEHLVETHLHNLKLRLPHNLIALLLERAETVVLEVLLMGVLAQHLLV